MNHTHEEDTVDYSSLVGIATDLRRIKKNNEEYSNQIKGDPTREIRQRKREIYTTRKT